MYPDNRGTSIRNMPKELLEIALDRIIDITESGIATVAQSDTVHATIRGKEYKKWYRFNIHNLVGQIQNAIDNHNGDVKNMKTEIKKCRRQEPCLRGMGAPKAKENTPRHVAEIPKKRSGPSPDSDSGLLQGWVSLQSAPDLTQMGVGAAYSEVRI